MDLPVAGSVVFGASFTVVGLIFAGVGAVTAQIAQNPRVAAGTGGAVVGAAFVLRAAGDVGDGTISWLSPIGLAQKARPYAGERWWPLLIGLVLAAALVAVAAVLVAHRDFGAGLVASRRGPAHARGALGHPLGLAVRLQLASVLWWSLALVLLGAAYGSIANSIEEFVADNKALSDLLASAGGASLADSYLATCLLILALMAGGCAVQVALRPRSEEATRRTEAILATGTSRAGWLGSHAVVALAGSALVVAAGGFGTGLAYGVVIGDLGQVPRLTAAALAYVPAVWLLVGVALALYGIAPRWAIAAWGALAACFVVGVFATLLNLPSWVVDLSPFAQTPQVPAADLRALPLAVLVLAGGALSAVGFGAFERRDVGRI